jgi:hypothetical protein
MAKFIPNRNFQKQLVREAAYQRGLMNKAEDAAQAAKSFAPVRTGAYRDSIKAHRDAEDVYVSAFDFKANWIEFGSVNNPPSAPLRRGVAAAGLKLRASSRR